MRLASLLLAGALAACAPAYGGLPPSAPTDADAHVEAACVLLAEGALCSFTAQGRAGSRCVKLLMGVSSGTVVASDTLCSGRLGKDQSSTLVLRFSTRPAALCGDALSECQIKVVAPAAAMDTATAWQGELKQSYSGPMTEAECKTLVEHKYDIYAHADCDTNTDPVQREDCKRQVREERDRESQYLVQDCLQYESRRRFKCEMDAKDNDALYQCESKYPYGGDGYTDGP